MNYCLGEFLAANEFGICEQQINYGQEWDGNILVFGGSREEVEATAERIIGELNYTGAELTVESFIKNHNYAAAFNMWMDDYMNNPQAYEDSHDSAVRHLKEKLNGEDPSYGSVCQEILIKYLEKV